MITNTTLNELLCVKAAKNQFTIPIVLSLAMLMVLVCFSSSCTSSSEKKGTDLKAQDSIIWQAPDDATIPRTPQGDLIKYGKELVAHTAIYLGRKGKVRALTNGMNCQNCHLDAGRQLYANSFATVAASYPKFSPRSGTAETIERKVNDCMERSLNGKKLDTASREMKAMVAYIKWVGSHPSAQSKKAAGTLQPTLLFRSADTAKGKITYATKCSSCHGNNGQGLPTADSIAYLYPPLWGDGSYNVSAGIFRLTKLAGFIKANMPFGATYKKPQLTDEEAWDIAAFINAQPRSQKTFAGDWPDVTKKPMDHPFGPYVDSFTEAQHKFGPYQNMVKGR